MQYIVNVDKDVIKCAKMTPLQRGPFAEWLNSKLRAHRFAYYLWFFVRILQIVCFFIVDVDKSALLLFNGVPHTSPPKVIANASFTFCEDFTVVNLPIEVRDSLVYFMMIMSLFVVHL